MAGGQRRHPPRATHDLVHRIARLCHLPLRGNAPLDQRAFGHRLCGITHLLKVLDAESGDDSQQQQHGAKAQGQATVNSQIFDIHCLVNGLIFEKGGAGNLRNQAETGLRPRPH